MHKSIEILNKQITDLTKQLEHAKTKRKQYIQNHIQNNYKNWELAINDYGQSPSFIHHHDIWVILVFNNIYKQYCWYNLTETKFILDEERIEYELIKFLPYFCDDEKE